MPKNPTISLKFDTSELEHLQCIHTLYLRIKEELPQRLALSTELKTPLSMQQVACIVSQEIIRIENNVFNDNE